MMSQEERFRSDSKLLRELAEDAYDTCVSSIQTLHALLHEYDEAKAETVAACVAGASEASDHDCGAAHNAPAAVTDGQDYFRRIGYPEGQIANMQQVWQAYAISTAAGRTKQLEVGGWATLPNKKRIMVFRGHAFEPPSDRNYAVPGPLKHLGMYDRDGARVVPSDAAPVIPQTTDAYPWWKPTA
jgi:hypothetical protein